MVHSPARLLSGVHVPDLMAGRSFGFLIDSEGIGMANLAVHEDV